MHKRVVIPREFPRFLSRGPAPGFFANRGKTCGPAAKNRGNSGGPAAKNRWEFRGPAALFLGTAEKPAVPVAKNSGENPRSRDGFFGRGKTRGITLLNADPQEGANPRPSGGRIFFLGGILSLRISNLNTNFRPPHRGGGFFSRFSPQKNAFLEEISTKMTPIC